MIKKSLQFGTRSVIVSTPGRQAGGEGKRGGHRDDLTQRLERNSDPQKNAYRISLFSVTSV
jgi:hypothetical protein